MIFMRKPVITLLTDFGNKDPYVAEMKAVILTICPEATIVDISHEVEKFNIRMGAFFLASSANFFPKGTIHVGVVDPGVGTKRRAIVVETDKDLFVGPDNGLLMLAAERQGLKNIYSIQNTDYMLPKISYTFHGRDIFSPVAAHLALGVPASAVGPKIEDYVLPDFAKPSVDGEVIVGEVLHVDGFGNVITNFSEDFLRGFGLNEGDLIDVSVNERSFRLRLCKAYGEVEKGELLAIFDSYGFLEFSVNLGNASNSLGAKIGDKVKIKLNF